MFNFSIKVEHLCFYSLLFYKFFAYNSPFIFNFQNIHSLLQITYIYLIIRDIFIRRVYKYNMLLVGCRKCIDVCIGCTGQNLIVCKLRFCQICSVNLFVVNQFTG